MENQKLKEQLEAIKKHHKETYDYICGQINILNESIDKTYSRPEGKAEEEKKEYTILSFVNNSGDLFNIDPDGEYRFKTWPSNVSLSLESCLDGTLKIHSIRRESDGEVFTLGDKIFQGKDHEAICKFSITEDKKGIIVYAETGMMFLPAAQKAPIRKPILITEDGVEIFEGDKYWSVICFDAPTVGSADYSWELDKRIHKTFSTKEAAEEYIKWNKPMYSLNDVKEALTKVMC